MGRRPMKIGCSALTYDISFCTEVCELEVGDVCEPSPEVGDDLCQSDLKCMDTGNTFTCQPPLMQLFGDDYSSSYYAPLFDSSYDSGYSNV